MFSIMLLVEIQYILLFFFNFNWVRMPKQYLGKKGSAFAFKTVAFNYANLLSQINISSNNSLNQIIETHFFFTRNKKKIKVKRWAPASLIHLFLAATCIAAVPNNRRLRPMVIPGALFFTGLLGSWWTALKAPAQLSWSWDPIECALFISGIIGINYTHLAGKITEKSTRSFMLSILPRLVRGGMLRTGHHAKVHTVKKQELFNSTDYWAYPVKYNTLIYILLFFNVSYYNTNIPKITLKKNKVKKLGPTWYTHIIILVTLATIGWPAWNKAGLIIGGFIYK